MINWRHRCSVKFNYNISHHRPPLGLSDQFGQLETCYIYLHILAIYRPFLPIFKNSCAKIKLAEIDKSEVLSVDTPWVWHNATILVNQNMGWSLALWVTSPPCYCPNCKQLNYQWLRFLHRQNPAEKWHIIIYVSTRKEFP